METLGWRLVSRGNMTADKKMQRDADTIRTDHIGKVFIVVSQDLRRCLICEQVFPRRACAEHATVACHPFPATNLDPSKVPVQLVNILSA